MLKLLNILLAVSLAVAPGLSINGLLHSLELCDLLAPETSHMRPAAHCAHHHQDTPPEPEDQPKDCNHVDGVSQSVIAPVLGVAPDFQPLPSHTCLVGTGMLQPPVLLPALPKDPRPPPGEPRVGSTLILI
jgi:hypothetical protein